MRGLKRTFTCLLVLTILFCMSCAPPSIAVYNSVSELACGAPLFIEGAYSDNTLESNYFAQQTGIDIQECLPSPYKDQQICISGCFDEDDNILNLNAYVGEYSNGYSINIAAHSKKIWSELSYSSADYSYGDDDTNTQENTEINGVYVLFFHYDDSKSENRLGYDVLTAEFTLNDINIYVESNALHKTTFELLVTSIIESMIEG